MAATRIRISKQLGKSTTPRSLVYTDLSNEQAYFVPPSGGDFVLMWDDSATDLSWLSTSSLINIYNNDGTISGTRNVDFSNPLNFNYDDGVINTSQLALQDSLTFNTSEAGTGSSILTVSPTIVSLAVNNVSVDTGSGVNVQPNLVRLYAEHNTTTDNVMLDITNQTGVISSTYSGFQGLRYFADYSANFTSLSLITKGYLDGIIATLPTDNIYTADGTLTSNRTLTGEDKILTFNFDFGTTNSSSTWATGLAETFLYDTITDEATTLSLATTGVYISWENISSGSSATLNYDSSQIRLSRFGGAGNQSISIYDTGFFIEDSQLNQGMEYTDDYGAYFSGNPRSIPDVGWVNAQVNGISQPNNQVVYGTGSGLSSESEFTYNPSTNTLTLGSTAGRLDIKQSTSSSQGLTVGSLEFGSYSVNNAWSANNLFYNGTSWEYRNTGKGSALQYLSGNLVFATVPSASAGSTITSIPTVFSVLENGDTEIQSVNAVAATRKLSFKSNYRTFNQLKSVSVDGFNGYLDILTTNNPSAAGETGLITAMSIKYTGVQIPVGIYTDNGTSDLIGDKTPIGIIGSNWSYIELPKMPSSGQGVAYIKMPYMNAGTNNSRSWIGGEYTGNYGQALTWFVGRTGNVTAAQNDSLRAYFGLETATGSGVPMNHFSGRLSINASTVYTATTPQFYVRGAGSTSSSFTAQFHNSTGTNNSLVIRDDGLIGVSTPSPTQPLDVNGNIRLRSGLYDSLNAVGSSNDILTSTGSATQWKSLSTLSIPTGTGAATRVAFWTGTNTLSNDGAFVWDNTNKKVTIGNYTMAAGFNIQGRGQINPGGFTPVSGTNILLDIGANPTSTGVNNVALYGIRAAPVLINDGTPTGNSMYAIQTTASVSNPTKADIVAAFNAGGSNTSPNLSQFYGIYGRIDEKTSSVTNLANRSALRFDMVKSDTGAGIDGHYGSAMAVNCSDFSTGGRWLQGTGISMSVTNAKLSWGVTIATSNTRGTGNVVRGISINSVASNAGTVVDTVYGVELALGVSSGAVITDYYGISFTGIPAGTNARFLYNTTTASNRLGGITSIGAADPVTSNSLTIRGLGTTSSTFGLQVHNSSGSNNAFVVRDDGKVGILTGNPTQALDINGGARFRGEFYDYANSPGTSGDILTSFGPGVGAVWQSLSLLNIPTGSGTAGQITYYTSGSVLGSENGSGANAFTWDSTNNRMGVRTSAPTSAIEVRGDSLGVIQTTTDGYAAANTTAATSGNQQISPAFRWRGNGWKTNATAASQSVEFRAYVIPVQGAAAPTGRLCWGSAIAGTWTDDQIVFTSAGTVGIGVTGPTAKLHLAAGSTAANSAPIKLTSGSLMTTPEIGSFEFLTDRLYFTQTTSSTRQTIAYLADLSTVNTLYTSSGSLTGARTVTLGTNLLEFTGSSGAGKLMFAKIDPSTNIHLKSQDTSGVDPLLSEIVMSTTSLTLGLGDSSIFSTETTYLTFSGAGTSLNYGGHEILLDASGVYLTEAGGLGWQYSNDYSVTVLDNNRSIPDIFTVRENNVENYTTISSTTSPIDLSGLPPDFLIAQGATQATFTFNLPASPKNGQICKLTFSTAVTALTIGAQGGLTILGTTATTAAVGTQLEYKFYQSISAWVRVR